ncbi:MAG TPA: MCE family protein [Sediminispirochaeta sp.]|nr:MCE family protein [Sediminispirochaeta sp.]
MKLKIKYAEQIVGLFVLFSVIALALVLILMGINQRWFEKNYHFYSIFPSGEGLSRGMTVKLKGFTIGAVDSIRLTEKNTVRVDFHIYETYYDRVKPNSVLQLLQSPLGLGGGGLRFHPGDNDEAPVAEESFIPSTDFPEGRQLLEQGLVRGEESDDPVAAALANIDPLMLSAQELLESLNRTVRTLEDNLTGRERGLLYDTLEQSRASLWELEKTLASTGKVTENLAEITGRLADTEDLLRSLVGEQGSLGLLLYDEELYRRIVGILTELEQTSAELSGFGAYVNAQQPTITGLLKEGEATLIEGRDVLSGLKNNPLIRGGIPPAEAPTGTLRGVRPEE